MIANGSEFIFIKLAYKQTWQYALSRLFSLFNPGNELGEVCRVLMESGKQAIAR